jgi:hypothetical protein
LEVANEHKQTRIKEVCIGYIQGKAPILRQVPATVENNERYYQALTTGTSIFREESATKQRGKGLINNALGR